MEKRFLVLFLLVAGLCACRRPVPATVSSKDTSYQKAVSFLDKQPDSAYYYFNKVISHSRDSLQIARACNNMAVIQYGAGDYFGAQEMLTQSLKFLDERNEQHRHCLSSDYNELGFTLMKLQNYAAALPLFDQAIAYASNADTKRIFLNNKALTFERKGDYVSALRLYRSILAQPIISRKEYARTLSNMAITDWLVHPGHNAAPFLLRALAIRQTEKDLWGQNSSYHRLSDYYMRSHPDSALYYAEAQYRLSRQLKSPDDRQEALRKLITLSPDKSYQSFFSEYRHLSDSLETARNAAKNQFALIRYDTEKSKADNLKLQKDNADNRYKIIKQQLILAIILILVVAGTIIAVVWYRRRKERMLLETQNLVKDNQLRISKKVHDVVANGLYRMMKEVQYQDIDKERLVGKIDHLYQQSRDISYEMPKSAGDFERMITELLQSFATDHIRVLLVGNSERIWEGISLMVRSELEAVLQELMVNMSKHSGACNVVIRFERDSADTRITYMDDGCGIPVGSPPGNGLTNTGNRIRGIGGKITFEPNGARGLRVGIIFPIA